MTPSRTPSRSLGGTTTTSSTCTVVIVSGSAGSEPGCSGDSSSESLHHTRAAGTTVAAPSGSESLPAELIINQLVLIQCITYESRAMLPHYPVPLIHGTGTLLPWTTPETASHMKASPSGQFELPVFVTRTPSQSQPVHGPAGSQRSKPGESSPPDTVMLRNVSRVMGTRGCVGHVVLPRGKKNEQPVWVLREQMGIQQHRSHGPR